MKKRILPNVYHTFEADTYLPDLEKQAGWKLTSVSDRYTNEPEGEQLQWTMNSGSTKGRMDEISCNS